MKKRVFIFVLSLLVVFCSSTIDVKAENSSILPDGEGCLSRVAIKVIGQGGNINLILIGIGSESITYPIPPDYCWYECTAAMWIIDNGYQYTEDIRLVGSEEEVWKVEVIVTGPLLGGQADFSKPGFYPLLNWDPNTICPKDPNTGYSLKLYSEDELGNLTLLIPDMSQISQYQTKEEDAREFLPVISYCRFTYYIVWSKPKVCIFTAEITATGQIISGLENNISSVIIGRNYYASKVEIAPSPPNSTVVLIIKDGTKNLIKDIRKEGAEQEKWKLGVTISGPEVNGAADPNESGYYPRLSWDSNAFCPPDPNTGKFRLYSEDEEGKRTLLVPDMTQIDQYQTMEEDVSLCAGKTCFLTYYIIWSKDIEFEMNLSAGWSMISLPVIPTEARLSALFPDAAVMYKFDRGLGYVRVQPNEDIQVGSGYWIFVYEDKNYVLTGQPINSYSKTVYSSGWEMIGGCTSGARPTTDTCDIGVIYKFVKGAVYVRVPDAEAIDPGEGFWILLKEVVDQCQLTVESI